jgi:hypothetical protein
MSSANAHAIHMKQWDLKYPDWFSSRKGIEKCIGQIDLKFLIEGSFIVEYTGQFHPKSLIEPYWIPSHHTALII